MAFRIEVWERAKYLLMAGYRPDEVKSNLEVENPHFDEFQREDLTHLIRHAGRLWLQEKKSYDN